MLKVRGIEHHNQPNVGSAGGWHRALSHGIEFGYDCVWLMDDDGYPAPEALERLAAELGPGVACVSSVVVREDEPQRFVFPFPRLDRLGLPVLFHWRRKFVRVQDLEPHLSDGLYPFAHLFNGALISASAAKTVGNVNTEYYLSGDEVDYFFRLRHAGEVLSRLDALHFHPDVSQRPISEMKLYYYVKNTLILNRLYFSKVPLRNLAAVVIALVRTARRNGIGDAMSYMVGGRRRHLARAVRLGLIGQLGRDFID